MNIPAAMISVAFGVTFFMVGSAHYRQPATINTDYAFDMIFSTEHRKARAAVSRLLISPQSAQFTVLRSVKVEAARYVCGDVRAKDKTGHYSGYRAFVYTVAADFARIDDDGRIARMHDDFRACPVSEEENVAQERTAISPGAVSMVKAVQKIIPTAESSNLSTIASQMTGGRDAPGGTMEQQLSQLAGRSADLPGSTGGSGSAGQQRAGSTFKAALDHEREWRADRPPTAWPIFPLDHPLARKARKRSTAEALALVEEVEDRWEQSKSGNPKVRPSSDEIEEACRALLAISPKSEEFPKAWAAFVRLRRIDRDARS